MLNGWHTADSSRWLNHLTPTPVNKSLHLLTRTGRFWPIAVIQTAEIYAYDYPLCGEKRTLNLVGYRPLDKLWFTAGNHHKSDWKFWHICA
jgi:hypothetical protein